MIHMKPNMRLREARLRLGYSEIYLSTMTGLSVYELGDIESRQDEFSTAIPAKAALLLCRVLKISPYEILEITEQQTAIRESPAVHIQRARSRAGLTARQLNDILGYEDGFIEKVESELIDIAAYPLELILDIANKTRSSRSEILNSIISSLAQ